MFFKDWETIKVWTLEGFFCFNWAAWFFLATPFTCFIFFSNFLDTRDLFLKKKIYFIFNWRVIAIQYCDGFCHTSTWVSHRYISLPSWTSLLPPSPPQPSRLSQSTSLGFPASYSKLPWLSVLHMVTYMFQCYSLKSSHPLLSPLCPKFCPLCACPLLSCA